MLAAQEPVLHADENPNRFDVAGSAFQTPALPAVMDKKCLF